MAGYIYRTEPADGMHDSLHAKAAAFQCGDTAAVLVSLDLLFVSRGWGTKVREAIEQETGVPFDNILVAATHTHSGPDVFSPFATTTDAMSRYEESLFDTCVQVAKKSVESAESAAMKWCSLLSENVASNRRNPLQLTDSGRSVIRVEDASLKVKAHLVSFACHPTVMGPENLKYSADLFGVAAREVEEKFPGSVCLMFNGAAADASTRFTRRRQTWPELERLGKKLARQIVQASRASTAVKSGTVSAKSTLIAASFQESPSVAEAEKHLEEVMEKTRADCRRSREDGGETPALVRPDLEGAAAQLMISKHGGWKSIFGTTVAEIELQVIRVGDIIICGLPGEFFGNRGSDLKNAALPKFAFIIGYANGYWGYIVPPKEAKLGGYEPIMSPIQPSQEPEIIRQAKALVKATKKGPSRYKVPCHA